MMIAADFIVPSLCCIMSAYLCNVLCKFANIHLCCHGGPHQNNKVRLVAFKPLTVDVY